MTVGESVGLFAGIFVGLDDSGLIVVGLRSGVGEAVGDAVRSIVGDPVGVTVNV